MPGDPKYVGLVIVSHSAALAEGLRELLEQFADGGPSIEAAAGGPDGSLGTDAAAIAAAIRRTDRGAGVAVLMDLGSAVLSARHALSDLDDGVAVLVDAPLVEGAVAAAVTAAGGAPLDDVVLAAREARDVPKL
jgi:PTS hybrid protein